MKKIVVFGMFVLLLVTVTACAPGSSVNLDGLKAEGQFAMPGPNPEVDTTAENGLVAGVLQGLWHGFISPVTLILSFFKENMQMYEVHNDGKEYNLGFLLGVAIVFLVVGFAGGRRR
jgi:hypothetical protein